MVLEQKKKGVDESPSSKICIHKYSPIIHITIEQHLLIPTSCHLESGSLNSLSNPGEIRKGKGERKWLEEKNSIETVLSAVLQNIEDKDSKQTLFFEEGYGKIVSIGQDIVNIVPLGPFLRKLTLS